MAMRAELCCYHCGYVAASVREEPGKLPRLIPPATGPGVRVGPNREPRCGRCGGPLYVDDVEAIPDEVAAMPRHAHVAA